MDPIRILHVDDDPGFVDLVSEFLERESDRFEVRSEMSSSDAIERFDADVSAIDCIVSDFDMPGADGLEFLEAIRERDADFPFILYTGKGSEEIASDAISAGVTDYLQKGGDSSRYTVLANRISNAVEQYRAKRAIEQRENQLSLFIEQSPFGVIEWNEDFEIVRLNEMAEEILGYSEHELTGKPWEAIVPSSDRDDVGDIVANLLEAQGGYHSINQNVRKNGERIICEWHNRFVTDDDGRTVAIFSQFRDVTDKEQHKRVIAALHDTAEDIHRAETTTQVAEVMVEALAELVDMPINGVALHDPSENVLRTVAATDRSKELAGTPTFRPGESLAWEVFETGEIAQYDDVSTIPGRHNSDTPVRSEILVPLGDHGVAMTGSTEVGTFGRTDVSLMEILASHAETALDRIERDRELRLQTQRLDAILENTTAPMFMKDEDGRYLFVNHGYREMFGLSDEVVVGRTDHELHPPKIADEVRQNDQEVIERGEALETEETVLVDGEERVFLSSKAPVYDSGEQSDPEDPVAVFGVASDITELRRRETQLRRERDRLDEFASVVSHDIRSPLTVAQGQLELMREECDSERIEAIDDALTRVGNLIEDLLTLAREGNQVSETKPVDLAELTDNCWQNVETGDATIHASVTRTVQADRTRLAQLLENLIQNAIEHADEEVSVTIGELEDGFYVADDGSGIPADDRSKVFDAGYSTAEEGTGFGLSIVKQVADAHGWTVRVTDAADGGTRFEITGIESVE